MIVYPEQWSEIGQPIQGRDIEKVITQTLTEINCPYLSFSGGLDSSLMLYYMTRVFDKVVAFTIGFPEDHPDIKYSRLVAKKFRNVELRVYTPVADRIAEEKNKKPGPDVGVRLFYWWLANIGVSEIIACDGIDEFMCGYYDHQQHPDEITYYKYLRRLYFEQLKPLNDNSGKINVYLPYLDSRLLLLLSQIPISNKVDSKNRKKIMVQMANGRISQEAIERWKYGFCDALGIKEVRF